MARLALYIGKDEVLALHLGARLQRRLHLFSNDDAGVTACRDWLGHFSGKVWLVADLADELFQTESLPPAGRRDTRALLARRLAQAAPGTPFHRAIRLPDAGEAGQHWLLTALPAGTVLRPWLDWLEADGLPLAGLHSSARLGDTLLGEQRKGTVLLASLQTGTGLRLSAFRNGALVFSRLAPVTEPERHIEELATELQRTCRYVQQHPSASTPDDLHIRLLWPEQELAAATDALTPPQGWTLEICALEHFPAALHGESADSRLLFLNTALMRPADSGYPLPPAPVRRWRRPLYAASALLLGSALATAYALVPAKEDSAPLWTQARALDQAAAQLEHARSDLPYDAATRHAALARIADWQAHHPAAETVLLPLSRALDAFPDITLDTLAWQTGQDGEAAALQIEARLDGASTESANLAQLDAFCSALAQQGYRTEAPRFIPASGGEGAHFSLAVQWIPAP